jgi:hypothetical protein
MTSDNPWWRWLSPTELKAGVAVVSASTSIELPTAAQLDRMAALGVVPILMRPVRTSDHGPVSRLGAVSYWGAINNDTDTRVDNNCAPLEGFTHAY